MAITKRTAFLGIAALGVISALSQLSTSPPPSSPSPLPSSASTASSSPKQISQAEADALPVVKRLTRKEDKIDKVTFYWDKTTPKSNNANFIGAYIGWNASGERPYLRFKTSYANSDWLFISAFTVQADGVNYEFKTPRFERDHYTTIWEWHDVTATERHVTLLKAIVASKKATIRFYGRQYHDDRIVPQAQKDAIKHVLDAFETMGGKI